MAMVLDALVSHFVGRLLSFMESEVRMLHDVDDDLQHLTSTLRSLSILLSDAESKCITSRAVADWLSRLRDLVYDADDLLDDYHTDDLLDHYHGAAEGLRRYGLSCLLHCFLRIASRHEFGTRIHAINASLERLSNETARIGLVAAQPERNARVSRPVDTSPVIVEDDIIGIDGDTKDLVTLLTGGTNLKCGIYAIVGMPGIGKTTLAQKVYNDPQVKCHFQLILWICLSKEYNYIDVLKQTVRSMVLNNREIDRNANTRAELDRIICHRVNGKRYLLVLDDVWDGKVWDELKKPLSNGANESRVLITTRSELVARRFGASHIHSVRLLSDKECWAMLCKVVFGEMTNHREITELENVGVEIARKCDGLPLNVKTIGGLLKTKEKRKAAWDQICLSPRWQLENLEENVRPGVLLSYEDLPSHLKQCLIYCSLFPEDFKFNQRSIVQMWIAEGFVKDDELVREGLSLEELGERYYDELVMRNLLQSMPGYYYWNKKRCKMHDLVRALARYASQNEHISGDLRQNQSSTKLRHLSFVNKESFDVRKLSRFKCLRTLLLSRNRAIKHIPSELFEKLRRLRVLDLSNTGIWSLPDSLGNLIHLRFLNVAGNYFLKLPNTISNLKNLETLNANGLVKLHAGVVELLNLRHLTVGPLMSQLEEMPVGITGLSELRTLDGFVANDKDKSNIEELKNLSNLTYVSMYKLERIAGITEAEGAMLKNKSKLNCLKLSCTWKRNNHQFGEGEIKRIENVFEGLAPPVSIEGIAIKDYFGEQLPSWVRTCSLTRLTQLSLDGCRFVKSLPPLGRLPELRVVHIVDFPMVYEIGSEFFCGTEGFPQLLELRLVFMARLERISDLEEGSLCSLKRFYVSSCPKLDRSSLPNALQFAANYTREALEGL